ncbi:hypothetical protein ACFQ2M_29225 [Kitasatospora saccharophila]|uniref:hypothetical protein n=1 Tax=Kitasatospora saccharophila TaxID=407973 RepID=UPI00363D0C2C
MNGVPQVTSTTPRQMKRRSRFGLLLWSVLQWVLIPAELAITLVVWIPFRTVFYELNEIGEGRGWFLLGWVQLLVRPLRRFVGPTRFVREWTNDQRRWEARLAEICRTAAGAFARGPGRWYAFRGWAYLRWGVGTQNFQVLGKDYRGALPEPAVGIAAQYGLHVFFYDGSSDFVLSTKRIERPGQQAEGQQVPGQYPAGQQAPGPYSPGPYPSGQQAPGPYSPGPYPSGQQAPGPYSPGPYPSGQQAPGPYPPGAQPSGQQAPGPYPPGAQPPGQYPATYR